MAYAEVLLTPMITLESIIDDQSYPFAALCRVFQNLTKDNNSVPHRSNFNPLALRGDLKNTSILERQPNGDYLYRLAGSELIARLGFNPVKHTMESVLPDIYIPKIREIFDQSLITPCGIFYTFLFPYKDGRVAQVTAICLPTETSEGVNQLFLQTFRGKTMMVTSDEIITKLTVNDIQYEWIDIGFGGGATPSDKI